MWRCASECGAQAPIAHEPRHTFHASSPTSWPGLALDRFLFYMEIYFLNTKKGHPWQLSAGASRTLRAPPDSAGTLCIIVYAVIVDLALIPIPRPPRFRVRAADRGCSPRSIDNNKRFCLYYSCGAYGISCILPFQWIT
ncbi:hypothetical protein ACJJTC_002047 [Scirpophaga incertulas]